MGCCSAIPAQATTIVGLPADTGTGNCFPFGCAYAGEYQQVYTSSQFSGPVTITDLEFFNTQENFSGTGMNSGTWNISLSTTAVDWNTITGNFSTNVGSDNTSVFSGNLAQPWAFGDTLHITLSTPFTYNPAHGNLLLDVNVAGASQSLGTIYFDTNGYNGGGFNGDSVMGRAYGSGSFDRGYGLVTGFSTDQTTSPVPEPASIFLLGSGLLGLVRARRKSGSF